MINYAGDRLKELLKSSSKTLVDLSNQTHLHAAQWSRLVNGTVRLSVDMAIRLAKVFPLDSPSSPIESSAEWLKLQFKSDLANARELDGPMYMNIKPF